EDGEVLAEDAHLPAIDGAEPGDHAVAVWPGVRDPEVVRSVPGQLVELREGARVQQVIDPLARGHLALGMLALHRARRAGVDCLFATFFQVGEFARGGVDVDRLVLLGARRWTIADLRLS